MATVQRALHRGTRRGHRVLRALADEFRQERVGLGLSQAAVAGAAGISRSRYTRVEGGTVHTLTILEACRLASVLGLELAVRPYPGGDPLRDGGHALKLRAFGAHARAPLRFRTEVPLPAVPGRLELRSWDAELLGAGGRTTIELEMRLSDAQAVERRIALKRRDDPSDRFLLLVADTRHNRRVLAGHPGVFSGLPRLRPTLVNRALGAGRHPPSGILLV